MIVKMQLHKFILTDTPKRNAELVSVLPVPNLQTVNDSTLYPAVSNCCRTAGQTAPPGLGALASASSTQCSAGRCARLAVSLAAILLPA